MIPVDPELVEEPQRGEFNTFVAESPYGDVLQTFEWGQAKEPSGWRPHRLGWRRRGRLFATASVLERRLPGVGKRLLYCSRGPIVDYSQSGDAVEVLDGLRTFGLQKGAILVKVDPAVPAPNDLVTETLTGAGWQVAKGTESGFGGTQPKYVMKLNLAPSEEEILASFHPKTRYNIRLAERKGVKVRGDCGREDLEAFYCLYLTTAKRDGFAARPPDYFAQLWEALFPSGMVRLFLTHYNGEPLSGALLFVLGRQAWYTYGASSDEHRNLMPNHLMQWEMIRWAKQQGCTVYDFRGVAPPSSEGQTRLYGLNRFKAGFNAANVEYLGEYDLPLSSFWYWAWTAGKPTAVRVLKRLRGKREMREDAA